MFSRLPTDMNYTAFLLLAWTVFLSSCGWDSDIDQAPEWKATWLIVKDSSLQVKWVRVDSGSLVEISEGTIPLSIDATYSQLWTVNTDGSITRREPETGLVEKSFQLPSGTASDLAIGLEQLYVSGSDSAIHFLDLKKETWNRLEVQGLPGLIETRSDRGYVVVNDTIVLIVQEQAFVPRDTLHYSIPIISLHNDPGIYTFLMHQPSPEITLSRINYHDQIFQFIERTIEEDLRLINPLGRSMYGTEYIGDLAILDGCLDSSQIICGDQFWPIWEEGAILVQRNRKLFRYDLFSGELIHDYGSFEWEITDGENIIN